LTVWQPPTSGSRHVKDGSTETFITTKAAASVARGLAYADESSQNLGRYRSIALVTLNSADATPITALLQRCLSKSNIREFKWNTVRTAQRRFAAIHLLGLALRLAANRRLRIDVLTWDTADSRHAIPGRDDVANLQRIYYHLFKNVFRLRWPHGYSWQLFPDENTAIDWPTVADFLIDKGQVFERIGVSPSGHGYRFISRLYFALDSIEQLDSKECLGIQLADLFAGIGAYSWNRHTAKQSNSSMEKDAVLAALVSLCKDYSLGVGLGSSTGLWSLSPNRAVNFWLYEPQHPMDLAPRRAGYEPAARWGSHRTQQQGRSLLQTPSLLSAGIAKRQESQ
jgi:hypothetical protein